MVVGIMVSFHVFGCPRLLTCCLLCFFLLCFLSAPTVVEIGWGRVGSVVRFSVKL